MDFNKVLQSRYSVRSFASTPVEQQKIDNILNAFKSAPTAMNMQPVRVYVVNNPDTVKKMTKATPCVYGAPLIFAICHDDDKCCVQQSGRRLGEMDASIAATYIMLAAANEGLGSCWVCRFDADVTKQVLGIEDNKIVQCLMIVGYPEKDSAPSDRHFKRLDLSESVIYK